MPWTEITRPLYDRSELHYSSDCSDSEWVLIEPLLVQSATVGRPRTLDLRKIRNAIMYIARAGCPWRMLPNDFPNVSSVRYYFYKWRDEDMFDLVNETLVMAHREAVGRNSEPGAAIIDSQSVKTTEAGGIRGFDAGKKNNGRKRHILVDTQGNLLHCDIHSAGIQDRDAAFDVIQEGLERFKTIKHIFADGGYSGDSTQSKMLNIDPSPTLEIVRRNDKQKGFVLLPRRWVVERTFAWLGRCRRLAKDWEETVESQRAWVLIASINRTARALARRAV